MTDIRTVGDALRWINKLKQLDCEGTQVMMVQALISGERERNYQIAYQAVGMREYEDAMAHIELIRARGK